MEGTVTAMDKEGNVLLIGKFFDLNSRKALEISIRQLYGIHVYSTTITPADEQEDNVSESVEHGENDYWLPSVHDCSNEGGTGFKKIV